MLQTLITRCPHSAQSVPELLLLTDYAVPFPVTGTSVNFMATPYSTLPTKHRSIIMYFES